MHGGAMNTPTPSARMLMACIGDASRFRLVQALCGGARCVTELATEVGLSQSCTTRHLQALERRRVVCGARDGKRVMYRLCHEEPALGPLLTWALSAEGGGVGARPADREGGAETHHAAGAGRRVYTPRDRSTSRPAPSGTRRPQRPSPEGAAGAAPSSARRAARGPESRRPTGHTDGVAGRSPEGTGAGDTGTPPGGTDASAPGRAGFETAAAEQPPPQHRRHQELEDYLL
jgi:DNA-binding transcriptional ArsR family regulator